MNINLSEEAGYSLYQGHRDVLMQAYEGEYLIGPHPILIPNGDALLAGAGSFEVWWPIKHVKGGYDQFLHITPDGDEVCMDFMPEPVDMWGDDA